MKTSGTDKAIDKASVPSKRPRVNEREQKRSLFIAEERMLILMAWVISKGIAGITTQKEFLKVIGADPTVVSRIRKGICQFSAQQYLAASNKFNVTMDWIFGNDPRPVEKLIW